jgi:GAF domain-containing protein
VKTLVAGDGTVFTEPCLKSSSASFTDYGLKRGELSQRLLAQAGMALATPLDFDTRLSNVAQLVVPDLADWCAVDMLETDGTSRRLTVVHTDPAKVALAHELYQRYPPRPDEPGGLYAVLRSGQSLFYPDLSDSFLEATISDREQLAIAGQLQLRSVMIVPLAARDRTLGAITFAAAESGRRYTSLDLALAEELARRAGSALDNALLYAEAQ